jgi:two-component system cell cycle sensor histidine kinase/response regulator CckA
VGLGAAAALLIAMIHNALASRWPSVVVLSGQTLVVGACLVLNRRGLGHVAARLLAGSIIIMAACLQMLDQYGVHDVAVLVYPGALIVAGTLLDLRWFVACTVLAMTALGLQYGIELSGLLHYQLSDHADVRQLIDSETILAVSALGVGLLMASLRRNVTRAHTAAASLRESENLYRSLFESVGEAIVVCAPQDGRIVDTNPRVSEWFGYDAAALGARPLADLGASPTTPGQPDIATHMARAAQGQPQLLEWQARKRDGHLFWVEVTMHSALVGGEPRVLVSLRDIDERKRAAAEKQRLQDQLRQAQKLESIGRLAGGVAHDFNNLLTSVLGNVDLAMALIPASHPLMENLEEIRHAARRSAELTGQLLTFSRRQPIAPVPIDTKNVLASVERMLRRLLGETIELRSEVAPDVGRIRADPGQIEQILVNLAVNARDAMPEGGRLTIVAENTTGDDSLRAAHPKARAGEFVRLSMVDTGTGMTEEVQQHIFEPFFTTKAQGKGTGLGLAMVFGAVEQNHGFILVRSAEGHGSTFELYFPRFLGKVDDSAEEAKGVGLPTGTEHILLVEDDDLVRHLSQRVLEHQGYRVWVCGTGAEAVAAGEKDGAAFDLLLTDLVLPDVDGRKLAKQLSDMHPDLRVLYCSGYTDDVIMHRGAVDEGLAFLAKPFTAEGLARKVRAVLDAPATASRPG